MDDYGAPKVSRRTMAVGLGVFAGLMGFIAIGGIVEAVAGPMAGLLVWLGLTALAFVAMDSISV